MSERVSQEIDHPLVRLLRKKWAECMIFAIRLGRDVIF